MKYKLPAIIALVFFLIVNTSYYWDVGIGSLSLFAFLLLGIVFFVLLIVLIVQGFYACKEKFTNKSRFVSVGVLVAVLLGVAIKPTGIINFEKWEGKDLLIAEREGGGCTTVFRLKEHGRFKERNICFGIDEITGSYTLRHDTIYFDKVVLEKSDREEYYWFAVINKESKGFDLVRYKNTNDTTGNGLSITRNELYTVKQKQ